MQAYLEAQGATVGEVLAKVFAAQERLGFYVLDEQGAFAKVVPQWRASREYGDIKAKADGRAIDGGNDGLSEPLHEMEHALTSRSHAAGRGRRLHREFVDPLTFSVAGEEGTYRRIEEVLDCWFESGSMPFAQFHYPFENVKKFEANFPGDFIVEYVGQVRACACSLSATREMGGLQRADDKSHG